MFDLEKAKNILEKIKKIFPSSTKEIKKLETFGFGRISLMFHRAIRQTCWFTHGFSSKRAEVRMDGEV